MRGRLQRPGHPGTTIIPPNTFADPDYHWQPPADQLYTSTSPRRATPHGGRLQAEPKRRTPEQAGQAHHPASLRHDRRRFGADRRQAHRRLAGKLGLKIRLSVLDVGQFTSLIYNYSGNIWKPDFNLTVWDWGSYYDPGQTLNCLTTNEIGSLNEPFWSNAQYDALAVQQGQTLDPQKRQAIIWQMQQIMYQQSPWIVITYPEDLEAYNTAKWTGWTQMFGGTGPAFNCEGNYDTYLNLALRPAATSHSTSGALIAVAIVVVLAAGAAVTVVLARRHRRRQAEEV